MMFKMFLNNAIGTKISVLFVFFFSQIWYKVILFKATFLVFTLQNMQNKNIILACLNGNH